MQIITNEGVQYRTKLMDQARAEAFSRCLSGNCRFQGVQVVESPRSAGKFFVSYAPVSAARQEALLQGQQEAREERAEAQAGNYLFVLEEEGRFFYCLNVPSGEVYETTEHSCSCPDHTYRIGPAGLQCKHILMLRSGRANVQGWN